MIGLANMALIIAIVGLAWWHRDPFAYVISGFALILYGLYFTGAITDINLYLGIFIITLGIYSFMKAAWDRKRK